MLKKIVLVFVVFSLSLVCLTGQDLSSFIDSVYLQEKNDSELRADYELLLPTLTEPYQIATLHYYMARAYQSFDTVEICLDHNRAMRKGKFISLFDFYSERENSVLFYEMALEMVESQVVNEAKWIALKADVISQLCLLKSLGYTMGNGLKVEKFAREALKLDPIDVVAQLLIASSKIYPPPIYFGSPKKALSLLDNLQLPDEITNENKFNIALGYGYTYGRLGRIKEALAQIDVALAVYPTNYFALAVRQMIANKELK